jgi:hypothetical protein
MHQANANQNLIELCTHWSRYNKKKTLANDGEDVENWNPHALHVEM